MKTSKKILLSFLALAVIFGTASYLKAGNPDFSDLISEKIKQYNPSRKDYVTVIDYRKNIFAERLYVFNVKTNEIVIRSNVSHAWNSGSMYATAFSNVPGTNKSCYGTFITRGTTYGKFGYSMIVDGLESGINNNAQRRSIIFHPSDPMPTPWSSGCFATPKATNSKIINLIKNGCLVIVIK